MTMTEAHCTRPTFISNANPEIQKRKPKPEKDLSNIYRENFVRGVLVHTVSQRRQSARGHRETMQWQSQFALQRETGGECAQLQLTLERERMGENLSC